MWPFKKKPAKTVIEHTPVYTKDEAYYYGTHFQNGQAVVYAGDDYATVVERIGHGVCTRYKIRLKATGITINADPINLKKVA